MGTLFAIIGSVIAIAAAFGQYQTATKANDINESVANTQNELSQETFEYNKAKDAELFEYNKWLNNMQMEREDTAVQRRMADLKSAGLNPLLAVGDAATSGAGGTLSRNQLNAPDLQGVDFQNPFGGLSGLVNNAYQSTLQGYNTYLDTKKANADIGLIQSQVDKNNADLFAKNINNSYLEQQLYDNQVQNYLTISEKTNDIEMQLKKLEGQKESNEYQRLRNEYQVLTNVKQDYENKILQHDWKIYENSQLTSSVVDKGAQSDVGKLLQDTGYYFPAVDSVVTNTNDNQIPNVSSDDFNDRRIKDILNNNSFHIAPNGTIEFNKYNRESKYIIKNNEPYLEAGNNFVIHQDGKMYYAGYQIKKEYEQEVYNMLLNGSTQLPIKMLVIDKYDLRRIKNE